MVTGRSSKGVVSGYQYHKLDSGEIRILTVYPRLEGDPIDSRLDCSLSPHRICKNAQQADNSEAYGKDIDFEALSYVWGDQTADLPIHIHERQNVSVLNVTKNLLAALKHLRFVDRERHFWVDAICINQDNRDELNKQVPMMSEIYSTATNVCVWLGERDKTSNLAMQLIPKIRNLDDFEDNVNNNTTCREWSALMQLMRRPWFTRRWVVQEIALARRATLHCGVDQISWSSFSEAIALFQTAADQVNQKFKEDKEYGNNPAFVGNVSAYAASSLVAATSRVVRKSKDNRVLMKVRGLEYLISTLTPFNARKSVDSIYAVLALAKDIPGSSAVITDTATIDTKAMDCDNTEREDKGAPESRRVFSERETALLKGTVNKLKVNKYPVDYQKTFPEACVDFLRFVFKSSRSLDIICRPWAPKEEHRKLPSWILTLKEEPYGQHRGDKTMIRRKADTLVGNPGESVYSASGRYPPAWWRASPAHIPPARHVFRPVHRTAPSAVPAGPADDRYNYA